MFGAYIQAVGPVATIGLDGSADFAGDVGIGGTNIQLNADGDASFAGDVTANSFVGTMPLDLDTLPELV